MEDPNHPGARGLVLEREAAAAPVGPELVGTPAVPALLGYTRRPLHLPDGRRIGLFSFSLSASANWLFRVDAGDMTANRYAIPHNDVASHGGALGADGHIYILSYTTRRAYRFNVAEEAFEELPCELPEGEYPWDALGHANGRIYFGTYPGAYFGEFDPAGGAWSRLDSARYNRANPAVVRVVRWVYCDTPSSCQPPDTSTASPVSSRTASSRWQGPCSSEAHPQRWARMALNAFPAASS